MSMILGHHIKRYLGYAITAAICYSVPMGLYVQRANFTESWLLYLGNFLFGITIAFFVFAFYRSNPKTRTISSMMIAAHLTSVMAIVFSWIAAIVLLLLMKPEIFGGSSGQEVLTMTAPQMENQKNDGLLMILFVNSLVGNVSTGFLMAIIFPFSIMRNQKGNKEGENHGPGKPVTKTHARRIDSLDQVIPTGGQQAS